MNDLADVLTSSGVDLKAEEAALLNRYNAPSQQQTETSFSTKMSNSFNSFESNSSGGYNPPRVNMMSSNVPGNRSSFYGAGTFNQPPGPYQSQEDRADSDRKWANKRKLERRQYHLNDPFLFAGWLQRRLTEQARKNSVSMPTTGLLSSTNQSGQEVAIAGPDNHEMIVTLQGEDLLYHDAPLVEILTLLSLAAEERLRAIVEDAATRAKGRRIGSHGVVPADLADLAVGSEAFESVTALPTPGHSAVSPKSNPLKREPGFQVLHQLSLTSDRLLRIYEQTADAHLQWQPHANHDSLSKSSRTISAQISSSRASRRRREARKSCSPNILQSLDRGW